jgi:acyl-CoA thioester hydrolase
LLGFDLGASEFVMRASNVLYEAPASFDDLLEVFVRTKRIGRSSMTNEYAAYRVDDDVLMCTADQTMVLVELGERRPTPIPEAYKDALSAFEGADLDLPVAR